MRKAIGAAWLYKLPISYAAMQCVDEGIDVGLLILFPIIIEEMGELYEKKYICSL
ncbi:MAG: hypothetical protein LIO94_10775 [Clostridiales bacterium]|nr:hypothetical protein [Clostridiales bacterium]